MSSRRCFLATASALAGFVTFPARAQTADSTPPLAKRAPAFDDYYGTTVSDPYRWMEDVKDPDLLPWLKAHDAHTRAFLSDVPGRAALRARVSELSGELSVTRKAVARASERSLNSCHLVLRTTSSSCENKMAVRQGPWSIPRCSP